ncbi:MAG: cytochrome C [Acidobacteria bacterium]|nr:MAG: cytochrome C [Acidobacteriota bacterium]
MAQIFPEWSNKVPVIVLAVVFGVLGPGATLAVWYYFSPEFTDVGYQPVQPIPYSHALHAGELELDCRYCHAQVERSAVASLPPTQVCMNCHKLVKQDSPKLEALRRSLARREPVPWVRIHNVPDYAYFNHAVHIKAGVGCSSCHGDVASMEVVAQAEPLSMAWCLDCHRNPEPHLRPPEEIYNTAWKPAKDHAEVAAELRAAHGINPPEACTACHR